MNENTIAQLMFQLGEAIDHRLEENNILLREILQHLKGKSPVTPVTNPDSDPGPNSAPDPDSIPARPEPVYNKVIYFDKPNYNDDGFFYFNVVNQKDSKSNYKLGLTDEGNGDLYVTVNSSNALKNLIEDFPSIYDICESENSYEDGANAVTVTPGKASLRGSSWEIDENIKIKFVK